MIKNFLVKFFGTFFKRLKKRVLYRTFRNSSRGFLKPKCFFFFFIESIYPKVTLNNILQCTIIAFNGRKLGKFKSHFQGELKGKKTNSNLIKRNKGHSRTFLTVSKRLSQSITKSSSEVTPDNNMHNLKA